jgi:hypothetical protein
LPILVELPIFLSHCGMAGSMRRRGKESWELRVHAGRDLDTGRKQYVTRTVRGVVA